MDSRQFAAKCLRQLILLTGWTVEKNTHTQQIKNNPLTPPNTPTWNCLSKFHPHFNPPCQGVSLKCCYPHFTPQDDHFLVGKPHGTCWGNPPIFGIPKTAACFPNSRPHHHVSTPIPRADWPFDGWLSTMKMGPTFFRGWKYGLPTWSLTVRPWKYTISKGK